MHAQLASDAVIRVQARTVHEQYRGPGLPGTRVQRQEPRAVRGFEVQRVAAGARLLEDKGFKRYAIVSHAMGSGMAYEFLKRSPHAPITAWAALSFYGNFPDIARRSFPVLDIYGRNDYRGIRGAATERRAVLDTIPGSRQLAAQQGGRFLAGAESTVLKEVADFLDAVPR